MNEYIIRLMNTPNRMPTIEHILVHGTR